MAVSNKKYQSKGMAAGRIPISLRVKAWWEGDELSLRQKAEQTPEEAAKAALTELCPIELIQDVWGPGAHQPSDPDFTLAFLKPLGLDPTMTVVNIGAGFGLLARTMAADFGSWVQALEVDPDMVALGAEMSVKAGLSKKAVIVPFDPATHVFRPTYADSVVAREVLYRIADKEALLEGCHTHLKDYGQLLFTEFILAEGANKTDLGKLGKMENEGVAYWTSAAYEKALADLKFDLRINEDMTASFLPMATAAWADFAQSDKAEHYSPSTSAILLRELDLWSERLKRFNSGALQVRRFHCLKGV